MEDFFARKKNACAIVVIIVTVISALSITRSYATITDIIRKEFTDGSLSVATVDKLAQHTENGLNNTFTGKNTFIEAFGYIQLLMGKSEQSNFETVKDTKGLLHTYGFAPETNGLGYTADKVSLFADGIADKNVAFLYVMTPDKYIPSQTVFPEGIPANNANETADDFLKQLASLNIDTVDLRQHIVQNNMTYDDMFYATDKHWRIESGFWAFTILTDILVGRYGLSVHTQQFYTDIENYNVVTYPNSYIGSLGRKTGKYYSGTDNFSIIFPKFKTDINLSFGNSYTYENEMSGLFEDVFISAYALRGNGDPYSLETDKYFSYKPNNYGIYHIENKQLNNAPKIAFIKDSMLNPVISFMSNICSEIYVIDPVLYNGDALSFINSIQLDMVIMSFCPENTNISNSKIPKR